MKALEKNIRVLATTYAVNPYKGSEDGMGWNFILQIASHQEVVAITRENNREDIEAYQLDHPDARYARIRFEYFDLPYWMRFWKKGGRGALLYYYLWQLFLPLFIWQRSLAFDVCHNVNFHNDWTPTFLWVLGKPLVWGPVGHHPAIPTNCLRRYGWKQWLSYRLRDVVKWTLGHFDPLLWLARWKADHVFCMNSKAWYWGSDKSLMPSVSSEPKSLKMEQKQKGFKILSVGRFTPLKGFDLTIASFAAFLKTLPLEDRENVSLQLIGQGTSEEFLRNEIQRLGIEENVEVISWVDRQQLDLYYQQASVFLFPSHEGAGMVVSEALAFGLPIVTLDSSGAGEFIDAQCGLTISYGGYSQMVGHLSQALTTLFSNPILREEMSKSAKERHQSLFDWDRKADKLKGVYQKVLAGKSGASLPEMKKNLITT
ncbi:glycosyltransferase family 4 protein [Persicobacter sp. CCB-QB2]|uniref:glycosyltransferase family 4 protein n=1 Tax=Persicobacter sp. CCB-QB2 TaxID=1561025 RepID=UPI0006A9BE31|nr:glycosyltransferase [Persicobacter sp. CCB-QB2]